MPNNYTPQTTPPSLSGVLDMLRDDIFANLNCHAVAEVVSFDSASATVSAQIVYCRQFLVSDAGNYVPKNVQYPLLKGLPVVVMGGGGAALTFPIAPGDECIVLFNDSDIQSWKAGAGFGGPPATPRMHDFSDGYALIGFSNPTSYDTSRARLNNGTAAVGVGTKILITADGVETLNTALQQLILGIQGATAAGSPIVDATGNIAMAATAIMGILE